MQGTLLRYFLFLPFTSLSTSYPELLYSSSTHYHFLHTSASSFMLLEPDQMLPPLRSLPWFPQTHESLLLPNPPVWHPSHGNLWKVGSKENKRKGGKGRIFVVSLLCVRLNTAAFTGVFSSGILSIYHWVTGCWRQDPWLINVGILPKGIAQFHPPPPFYCHTHAIRKFPGYGSNRSCSCQPTP